MFYRYIDNKTDVIINADMVTDIIKNNSTIYIYFGQENFRTYKVKDPDRFMNEFISIANHVNEIDGLVAVHNPSFFGTGTPLSEFATSISHSEEGGVFDYQTGKFEPFNKIE